MNLKIIEIEIRQLYLHLTGKISDIIALQNCFITTVDNIKRTFLGYQKLDVKIFLYNACLNVGSKENIYFLTYSSKMKNVFLR